MCGIVGSQGKCSEFVFKKMLGQLKHRGPDNLEYARIFDKLYFGHTRLSIIDLSTASNQPLWDASYQVCIVFNGEIYNYKSLKEILMDEGFIFNSSGDAEVILNLYLRDGPSCLSALDGIFAFAIWDNRNQSVLIARDPYGVKPLYYTQNEDGFYFSSEMKALLTHPSISKELNIDAIFRTIVFLYSPGSETILKNIWKLEAGYYLIIKDTRIVEHQCYKNYPTYSPEKMSACHAEELIDQALFSSVKKQMVSDVPVGAFLSGGLDSSLIVAMAKKAGLNHLECFTIDDGSDGSDGIVRDLPYAKKVAALLNLPLTIVLSKMQVLDSFFKMIYCLDEPQADLAPLNVMLIAEKARQKGIKVLFSGAGGDDVFTGYRRHIALVYEKYWSWLPFKCRLFLQNISQRFDKKNIRLRRLSKLFAYASLSHDERLLSYFYWIEPDVVKELLTDDWKQKLKENPMSFMLDELKSQTYSNRLEKMLFLEKKYFLVDHNFNYTDKMSMMHGVEVRVPFLDESLLMLASKIPSYLKQKGREGKWILKKMAERYLPKKIIYRSKTGFGAPLDYWMKTDLKPIMDDFLSEESVARRGLFKFEKVNELIQKNTSGEGYYTYPIFSLLCIEAWCRIFLDAQDLDFSNMVAQLKNSKETCIV